MVFIFLSFFLVWTSPWPIFFLKSLVVSMGSFISSCCQCGLSSWIRCPINGTCLGYVCVNIFGHLHSKFGKNCMSIVQYIGSWGYHFGKKKFEFSIQFTSLELLLIQFALVGKSSKKIRLRMNILDLRWCILSRICKFSNILTVLWCGLS